MKNERKRLNGDELATLAAKTGISERYLRVLNTRTDEPPLTEAKEEWLQHLEDDLAEERKRFDDACSEHNLLNRLNGSERKLLFRVWSQANAVKFLLDTPRKYRHREDAVTREEAAFVRIRRKLLRSKGWKALPNDVAKDVQKRLFTVEAEPWA